MDIFSISVTKFNSSVEIEKKFYYWDWIVVLSCCLTTWKRIEFLLRVTASLVTNKDRDLLICTYDRLQCLWCKLLRDWLWETLQKKFFTILSSYLRTEFFWRLFNHVNVTLCEVIKKQLIKPCQLRLCIDWLHSRDILYFRNE